jgi:hypothetical protein
LRLVITAITTPLRRVVGEGQGRLRGLYDKPDRWDATIDIPWRAWEAFYGIITPADIVKILRASGSTMAHGMSDDG